MEQALWVKDRSAEAMQAGGVEAAEWEAVWLQAPEEFAFV